MSEQKQVHVLLTEDNLDLQGIYKAKLEADGFLVETATDGGAALDRIREQIPDVILLDIVMPGMDGLEFLRHAQKEKRLQGVPIIVMTNLGQDEDRSQCEKLGAKKFLVKTETSLDQVTEAVRNVLKQSKLV